MLSGWDSRRGRHANASARGNASTGLKTACGQGIKSLDAALSSTQSSGQTL